MIGLAPNLFYGTGIPACILVLRGQGRKARRSARARCCSSTPTREYREGRAQNYLRARAHREDRQRLPARSTTSPASPPSSPATSWRENDYNLNIRRYADNAPPPEPHDVRAHLLGGVPKAEVEAKARAVRRPRLRPAAPARRAGRPLLRLRRGRGREERPQAAHRGRRRGPGQGEGPRATPSTPGGPRTPAHRASSPRPRR